MKPSPNHKQNQLVLVGGGHSHVQVLESFAMDPPLDTRITLVVDQPVAMYSGMVPGFVAGQYRRGELEIDVLPLARRIGARVVFARALAIDPENRRLRLEGRPDIEFDIASVNIGSTVAALSTPGVREHAIPTRPIGKFVARVDELLDQLRGRDAGEPVRVAVVGAGVGGVELAFGVGHRIRQLGKEVEVTLVESGPEILPGYSAGMRRRAVRTAEQRGIRIETRKRVERVEGGQAFLAGGGSLPFDLLLWVTGALGHSFFGDSNLPTDSRGFARVRSTLQLRDHDHIFAAGDCATLERYPQTPKAGVYAVRQGPILAENLRRAVRGGARLEHYRPQHDFLTLINTGDGRSIGGKWMFSFEGAWVFKLKDRIDRKFMHRFQPLEDTGRATAFDAMNGDETEVEMLCGGCAAKLGQQALQRALSRLGASPPSQSVELGLAQGDDAACYTSPEGQRVVSSVDQFRAFTDDPYLVGRVGAVNAASDVYAKGVAPRFAQAIIALPETEDDSEREETLFQLMAGAEAAFEELDVALVGGHTTTTSELLVGFHIEGFASPDQKLLTLDALGAGQALILTKPLGTGVVFRADMMGLLRGPWFEQALSSMLRPNREAAEIARDHSASAATDVTGFGLAGHLAQMLRAADLTAVVDVSSLPALPGSLELLETGLRSTFHEENAKAERGMHLDPAARRHPKFPLLFDPQTSGGLLFGVPTANAAPALAALLACGHTAAIIGSTGAAGAAHSGSRLRISASPSERCDGPPTG